MKLPPDVSLVTKMSVPPALIRLETPPPGFISAVPEKEPVTTTSVPAVARPSPTSTPVPPSWPAQIKLPLLSNLATNASELPALVRFETPALGSKSTVALNEPVISTFPALSTWTSLPESLPVPPMPWTHSRLPLESYLARNTSPTPRLVSEGRVKPGPKKAVPWNEPVT